MRKKRSCAKRERDEGGLEKRKGATRDAVIRRRDLSIRHSTRDYSRQNALKSRAAGFAATRGEAPDSPPVIDRRTGNKSRASRKKGKRRKKKKTGGNAFANARDRLIFTFSESTNSEAPETFPQIRLASSSSSSSRLIQGTILRNGGAAVRNRRRSIDRSITHDPLTVGGKRSFAGSEI